MGVLGLLRLSSASIIVSAFIFQSPLSVSFWWVSGSVSPHPERWLPVMDVIILSLLCGFNVVILSFPFSLIFYFGYQFSFRKMHRKVVF